MMKVGAYGETSARHPHGPGVGREVPRRPRRPHSPPGALGHVQPLVSRLGEPILRTLAAAQKAGVDVITPRPGETYEHGRPTREHCLVCGPAQALAGGARQSYSLSSVVDDQFPHVQTADAELVDLDDAEAGASDRQAADDQATEGERADRDRSDGESSDGQAADTLGL